MGTGAADAAAAPRISATSTTKRPARPRLEHVTRTGGTLVSPTATQLKNGTLILAFERLFTAHSRRVYVTRRRATFGWRWAQAVPMVRGDFSHRHASLLTRPGDQVLLYLEVGDSRRRKARIRRFESTGDQMRYRNQGLLTLRLPAGSQATYPFAARAADGGVLLTVTVPTPVPVTGAAADSGAGARQGCYLGHSPKGRQFGLFKHLGAGERCRVISLGKNRLLLTYHTRTSRVRPYRTRYRLSTDNGTTWTAPQPISPLWGSSDAHAIAARGGGIRFFYVVNTPGNTPGGSAVQTTLLRGAKRSHRRLTRPPALGRDITPFGLVTPTQTLLFFARETNRLRFDILQLPVR